MKAKTEELLSKLLAKESMSSLTDLWSDISPLSRTDFEVLLERLGQKPAKKKRAPAKKSAKTKPSLPQDDKPVTRIAHQLRERSKFDDETAIRRLSEALLARGISQSFLPVPTIRPLEIWLERLVEKVTESTVMAIAKRLK
jgi:hypothetical protein